MLNTYKTKFFLDIILDKKIIVRNVLYRIYDMYGISNLMNLSTELRSIFLDNNNNFYNTNLTYCIEDLILQSNILIE
jgi:hypothetical protein